MKPYACAWSYYKIHPGRGLRYVRIDSKQFAFLSYKSRAAFLRKGNPRKCLWTAIYRRLHHKGQASAENKKKKARKVERVERAIVGASVELLRKRREEKPEDRKKAVAKAKTDGKAAAGAKAGAAAAKGGAAKKPAAAAAKSDDKKKVAAAPKKK